MPENLFIKASINDTKESIAKRLNIPNSDLDRIKFVVQDTPELPKAGDVKVQNMRISAYRELIPT